MWRGNEINGWPFRLEAKQAPPAWEASCLSPSPRRLPTEAGLSPPAFGMPSKPVPLGSRSGRGCRSFEPMESRGEPSKAGCPKDREPSKGERLEDSKGRERRPFLEAPRLAGLEIASKPPTGRPNHRRCFPMGARAKGGGLPSNRCFPLEGGNPKGKAPEAPSPEWRMLRGGEAPPRFTRSPRSPSKGSPPRGFLETIEAGEGTLSKPRRPVPLEAPPLEADPRKPLPQRLAGRPRSRLPRSPTARSGSPSPSNVDGSPRRPGALEGDRLEASKARSPESRFLEAGCLRRGNARKPESPSPRWGNAWKPRSPSKAGPP